MHLALSNHTRVLTPPPKASRLGQPYKCTGEPRPRARLQLGSYARMAAARERDSIFSSFSASSGRSTPIPAAQRYDHLVGEQVRQISSAKRSLLTWPKVPLDFIRLDNPSEKCPRGTWTVPGNTRTCSLQSNTVWKFASRRDNWCAICIACIYYLRKSRRALVCRWTRRLAGVKSFCSSWRYAFFSRGFMRK